VSFGVFYKDISDMQINVTEELDPNDLPQSILDTGITPGAGALTLTQRKNIGSSSLWGAEFDYSQQLSFLPDPWTGLGVFFNATYINPEDDDIFALTAEDGIAKRTINTGFSYKKNRFNGRVSANIVGERLRGLTGIIIDPDTGDVSPGTGANSYRKEYLAAKTQIDVSLSYELTRSATIFCNISNIFNEEQFRYNETSEHATRWGQYGRRFTVGVQGSF
jgi:outer membrane receptor protein involved in Fe transport